MVDREPSMADADIAAENGDENSSQGHVLENPQFPPQEYLLFKDPIMGLDMS